MVSFQLHGLLSVRVAVTIGIYCWLLIQLVVFIFKIIAKPFRLRSWNGTGRNDSWQSTNKQSKVRKFFPYSVHCFYTRFDLTLDKFLFLYNWQSTIWSSIRHQVYSIFKESRPYTRTSLVLFSFLSFWHVYAQKRSSNRKIRRWWTRIVFLCRVSRFVSIWGQGIYTRSLPAFTFKSTWGGLRVSFALGKRLPASLSLSNDSNMGGGGGGE